MPTVNFWSFICPRWCILLFISCSKFDHMSNLYNQNPKNLGQFSKHPLYVQFDQILPEIFKVKETWCHSFIFMLIDLTERKAIEIWTFCVKSNWLKILDLLMVFLRIILVDIGTFDGEQNHFLNKLFRFLLFSSPSHENKRIAVLPRTL